jgi:isopenicillin-N epimerase
MHSWAYHRRQLMLDADEINLNAGTLSPTPKPVFAKMMEIRKRMASRPTTFFLEESGQLIRDARSALARFLKVKTVDLLLTPNVTQAMLLAINAIPMEPGDRVLTTTGEYGAMLEMWKLRAQRDGIHIDTVDISPVDINPVDLHPNSSQSLIQQLESKIHPRTTVLFFSHVSSPTGLKLPAQALCDWAKKRDMWVVIDGAHAVGAMPVEPQNIGAHAYGANIHKWMMGPATCGFLHVHPHLKPHLRPTVPGWGEQEFDPKLDPEVDNARIDQIIPRFQHHGTRLQFRLEYTGVADRSAQMVLPYTIEFVQQIGLKRIWNRQAELAQCCVDMLHDIGVEFAGAIDPQLQSNMPIFHVDGPRLSEVLWKKHRIRCPVTNVGDRHFLRVSTAWWNTKEQILKLRDALRKHVK